MEANFIRRNGVPNTPGMGYLGHTLVSSALPVSVPQFVGLGSPGFGYPENWCLVRWINGEHPPTRRHEASKTRRSQREDSLAQDLADVIRTLRALKIPAAARSDADLRWYRTQPLEASDAQFRAHLAVCRELPGLDLNLSAAEAV